MSWSDKATGLGKKTKKATKEIHSITTRKGKSGGYIHTHHHTAPEMHPDEEHVSPDEGAMLQHMQQNMGGADPAASAPDPAAAAGAAAAPQGAPSPVPGM